MRNSLCQKESITAVRFCEPSNVSATLSIQTQWTRWGASLSYVPVNMAGCTHNLNYMKFMTLWMRSNVNDSSASSTAACVVCWLTRLQQCLRWRVLWCRLLSLPADEDSVAMLSVLAVVLTHACSDHWTECHTHLLNGPPISQPMQLTG